MSIKSYLWLFKRRCEQSLNFFKSKSINNNKSNNFTAELPEAKYVITYMIMNN